MGRPKVHQSEAEAIAARRDRQRARYAAMSPEDKRAYAARKNKRRRNMPQMVIEPSRFTQPEPVRHELESVDSFLARGGRIDRLPVAWA